MPTYFFTKHVFKKYAVKMLKRENVSGYEFGIVLFISNMQHVRVAFGGNIIKFLRMCEKRALSF